MSEFQLYVHKPTVRLAIQFTVANAKDVMKKIPTLYYRVETDNPDKPIRRFSITEKNPLPENAKFYITTITGQALVSDGDYIVQEETDQKETDVDGKLSWYPCPKDVFEESYDLKDREEIIKQHEAVNPLITVSQYT